MLRSLAMRLLGGRFRLGTDEDEHGAVAAEYVLLLGLIALAIIVAATAFGFSLADLYEETSAQLSTAGG